MVKQTVDVNTFAAMVFVLVTLVTTKSTIQLVQQKIVEIQHYNIVQMVIFMKTFLL